MSFAVSRERNFALREQKQLSHIDNDFSFSTPGGVEKCPFVFSSFTAAGHFAKLDTPTHRTETGSVLKESNTRYVRQPCDVFPGKQIPFTVLLLAESDSVIGQVDS